MQTIGKACTSVIGAALVAAAFCPEASAQAPRSAAAPEALAAPGADAGALVVLDPTRGEALLLDPRRNQVVARFPTGPDPRGVALSPDGRYAYITSYGWEPPARDGRARPARDAREPMELDGDGGAREGGAGGRLLGVETPPGGRGVTVLDLERRQIHAIFQPAKYRNLSGVTVGSDGKRLWATSAAEAGVVELDAHSGEVKMLWKTGGTEPSALAISRNGRLVFVANSGSDEVTVIDRVTVVPTQVPIGRRPMGLALAPGGGELWVANAGDHTISVITTQRLREAARFPSGGTGPVQLSFHPTRSEVWVSHSGSRNVTVVDVVSGALLAEIDLPAEPHAITFSNNGRHAYVSSPASGRVFAIDVEARGLVEQLDAGARPGGLVWSRHGSF